MMKEFVTNEINIDGEILDNNSPDFMQRAVGLKVDSAPTLILFGDSDRELFRGQEVQEVKDFLVKVK